MGQMMRNHKWWEKHASTEADASLRCNGPVRANCFQTCAHDGDFRFYSAGPSTVLDDSFPYLN